MKLKTLAVLMGAAFALHVGIASAESTYGYDSTGTGPVEATAKAKVTVKVPLLILLRVGTAGSTVDELTFTAAPTGMTTDGNSNAISWDGTAPAFSATAAPSDTLAAYGWTNSPGGGSLTCAAADAKFTAADGLTPADITVTNAGTLAHPGATTACGSTTAMAKNTLLSSSWTYAVKPAALQTAAAGTHTETITYTAVTL